MLLPLIILSLVLPLTLAESHLRIFHRLRLPLAAPLPFAQRGTLHVTDSTLSFTPSTTVPNDLQQFANLLHDARPQEALYQVALEREGDPNDHHWDVSSVKAVCLRINSQTPSLTVLFQCLLPQILSDSFVFHVSRSGKPFALDYFVAPIPHDGSCPMVNTTTPPIWPVFENTTVALQQPFLPPL
jgi:hypothetical protein